MGNGEVDPKVSDADESLRRVQMDVIDGAQRWFWSFFAVEVASEAKKGRRMEQWSTAEWGGYRTHILSAADGLARYILERADGGALPTEDVLREARRIIKASFREAFASAVDKIRDNSLRIPEPMRAAYWDGIRSWASQQIEGVDEEGGRPKVRASLTIPELEEIERGLRGVAEVSSLALGNWVHTSAQQMILGLRDIITRGNFESDWNASPYPMADLSRGGIKAHAEIRPTDFDIEIDGASTPAVLQAMQEIAKSLKRRGVHVAEVGDVLMALWVRSKAADGWACITLDDICEQLGRSKRAGRQGGYEPRARDTVREAVEKAARVHLTVRDLPADHKMRKGVRVGVTDPFVMIRNRVTVQGDLWNRDSTEKWDAVYIQPGAFARHAIERNGAEFLIRSRKLFALDDYRHRSVKLLGQRLEELFRFNARNGPARSLRVTTLIDYADLRGERLKPETREALEAALDRLIEVEVLRGWQYAHGFNVDDKIRDRMTARRLEEWAESFVEIEAAQEVAEQYAPIAQKALEHSQKARQRTERATKKAAQEKAPPAGMGAELRALRTRLGLSVLVAGERIGISSASVSRVENGATVSASVAEKVRAWLKTTD